MFWYNVQTKLDLQSSRPIKSQNWEKREVFAARMVNPLTAGRVISSWKFDLFIVLDPNEAT